MKIPGAFFFKHHLWPNGHSISLFIQKTIIFEVRTMSYPQCSVYHVHVCFQEWFHSFFHESWDPEVKKWSQSTHSTPSFTQFISPAHWRHLGKSILLKDHFIFQEVNMFSIKIYPASIIVPCLCKRQTASFKNSHPNKMTMFLTQ